MGRRQRIRKRKNKTYSNSICLDNDTTIIKLKQWMFKCDWHNEKYTKLALFRNTGRGVKLLKSAKVGDILVEVPYKLMITFTTLETLLSKTIIASHNTLEMHDLLSLFLAIERHKGRQSQWNAYIDSLPSSMPALPWLCSSTEVNALPNDVKTVLNKKRNIFELSWQRLKRSINSKWKCECCQMSVNCVISYNLYTWAYVMVNTRAVYVDPNIVRELSSVDILNGFLSDEPCMALCPYLDMFNHSSTAKSDALLVKIHGKWVYRLITLTESMKHEEAFISYGSHDNFKLLCEYGFFIPSSDLDIVTFEFAEILKVSKINLSERQYRFIVRKFDESLYIDRSGVSFNLKALCFVMLNPNTNDWCLYIFSEYSEDQLLRIQTLIKDILTWKISEIEHFIQTSASEVLTSDYFKSIVNYLTCQGSFLKEILLMNGSWR